MSKRKSISKKLRFELFKRDVFTCQYCGQTPPAIVLEIDHIKPVALGGDNSEDNLLTSCFDCNRGKAARTLDVCPETVAKKASIVLEKKEQLKEYEKLLRAQKRRVNVRIKKICDLFTDHTQAYINDEYAKGFMPFVKSLAMPEIEDAMDVAAVRFSGEPEQMVRYFCGVCWNKIRSQENG